MFLELRKIFPEAPVYTLLYDEKKMGKFFEGAQIKTSFLQKFPRFLKNNRKHLLPFLPVAAETLDFRDFDLVISSSSAFVKSVITRPATAHICYCHQPSRFLWEASHQYLEDLNLGFFRKSLARILIHYLRVWDKSSARRVDYFVANSKATREKIKKYYRQDSIVIYPPVRLSAYEEFLEAKDGGYFLIISQLTPYKRIDLAVEAFNKLKLPLIVIGEGSEFGRLREMASENVKILGWQSEKMKNYYMKNCTAFIFAGEDDFGLAPVEAMGWGKPVLAFRSGGACETVLEGICGEFFDEPKSEILADGVRRLRENLAKYSPLVIRKRAEKFSEEKFRQEIMDFVKKLGYNRGEKRLAGHLQKPQSAF